MGDGAAEVVSGQGVDRVLPCVGGRLARSSCERRHRATPLDRAEGYRYLTRLLRQMMYTTIENADPDFPRLHELDRVKLGADNPDNVYLSANIRGDRTYKITGTRGSIYYFSIGSKANRYAIDGTMASTGELTDKDLVVEPDGTVEIIVSAEPHDKNWLPLAPDSTGLVVRQTYMDRATEVPGQWTIERVGEPIERKELNPEQFAKALQTAAFSLHGTAAMFASWTEMFMERPNEMPDFGQEFFQKAGGDPEIFYAHGYWTLKPGQAWVIETEVPECPYWNFQLDNWWMESLDWERKITINKHTAKLNDDGTLTIVVAERDPGWAATGSTPAATRPARHCSAGSVPATTRIPTCTVVDLEAS